jgi:hypothetical protein
VITLGLGVLAAGGVDPRRVAGSAIRVRTRVMSVWRLSVSSVNHSTARCRLGRSKVAITSWWSRRCSSEDTIDEVEAMSAEEEVHEIMDSLENVQQLRPFDAG